MKKLLILSLISILSTSGLAKIGDTYICQMGEYYSSKRGESGFEKKVNESFTFERGSEYIKIFSKEEGGFARGTFDVYDSIGSENFKAKGWQILISYHNHFYGDDVNESGLFNYVELHNLLGITSAGAICNILK